MKNWKSYLEARRELAQAYTNTLSGVPQDPTHHPEGDALIHTKLVRRAIPRAIQELKMLQASPNFGTALGSINFDCSPAELELLALSAWLHDIGKSTATTIGGQPWQTPGATGKIQAIGHESPQHYQPQLEKLKDIAPPETVNLYLQNKDLINFVIEHHMDFTSGMGFSKGFVMNHFQNGVVNNSPEMKLLLILMWADKMGRKPEDTIAQSIGKNASGLSNSIDRSMKQASNMGRSQPFQGTPEDLATNLLTKGMARNQRVQALKGKFPYLTDDQITTLIPEGFRGFVEMTDMQPQMIPANIPVDQNVRLLSQALKQGDSNVEVYMVGGAVRDFLHHQHHGAPGTTHKPKDVDLTTNLSEEEILQRLRSPYAMKMGIRVKEKESVDTFGVVFATLKKQNQPEVKSKSGPEYFDYKNLNTILHGEKEADNDRETYEIAPFRIDVGGDDGRRPDHVERGTIQDDAMRRDLTMNNLYYDFDRGVILDFNPNGQGVQDIKNGVARTVGDPAERFKEDTLRVLRLIRFFSRFNQGSITQSLDPKTAEAINDYRNLRSFKGMSSERIVQEFFAGIKQSQNTASYLQNLVDLNLMDQVFPGLRVDVQGITRIGNLKNPRVIVAWLLRDNQNISGALNKLKYPAADFAEPIQVLINTIHFGPEQTITMIRNRDKRLLNNRSAGANGVTFGSDVIQQHNDYVGKIVQQDLNDLAKLTGDQNTINKLGHFGSYKPVYPSGEELMQRGMKDQEVGQEQRRVAANHYQQSYQDYLGQQPNASTTS